MRVRMDAWDEEDRVWQLDALGSGALLRHLSVGGETTAEFRVDVPLRKVFWTGRSAPLEPHSAVAEIEVPEPAKPPFWRNAVAVPIYAALIAAAASSYPTFARLERHEEEKGQLEKQLTALKETLAQEQKKYNEAFSVKATLASWEEFTQ